MRHCPQECSLNTENLSSLEDSIEHRCAAFLSSLVTAKSHLLLEIFSSYRL